jgi:polyisoprenoid-binding protein YceI
MSKWIIDPDHSVAAFSVRHMMVANVHGQFNKIAGTIDFDPSDVSKTSIALEISVESIFTGIKKRDDHLRSQDFFDADKYPGITFQSTKAERTGFSNCKITGDLTMRGITCSVTIDVNFSGPVNSPFGETSMGFSGKFRVNREDFAIMWNEPMENGGVVVGKDIEVVMDLETDLVP